MGADQCGVPGCDWRRSNTNPKCNSNSNAFGNTYSNTNIHRHAKAHSFTKASSDTKAQADSAAKTLIRYRDNRQGATKVSSEASTSFAIDRYAKKSLNRSACMMGA
jgi:hypothetical protein